MLFANATGKLRRKNVTLYKHVHWIVPIIVIIPFGASVFLSFMSTFNFFVQSYRSVAASAMASNSFMRSALAGALPLAARPMFKAMTNTGALAFLAGVMTLLAPLPSVLSVFSSFLPLSLLRVSGCDEATDAHTFRFIFYKYGPQLRKRSRYAQAD